MKQYKRSLRRDLTGQVFNGIRTLRLAERDKLNKARWEFICHCGKVFIEDGYTISSGKSKSCGCLKGWKTHGLSNTRVHNIWSGMKARCNREQDASYHKYGGRGINYCESWEKFENFYNDMGNPPEGFSLDRIDNNKGYCRENCRWTDVKTQARNTRTNRMMTYKDKTMCVTEWAEIVGLERGTISSRLRQGWSVERILTTPSLIKRKAS